MVPPKSRLGAFQTKSYCSDKLFGSPPLPSIPPASPRTTSWTTAKAGSQHFHLKQQQNVPTAPPGDGAPAAPALANSPQMDRASLGREDSPGDVGNSLPCARHSRRNSSFVSEGRPPS